MRELSRVKANRVVIVLCVVLLSAASVSGWGPEGHIIVAKIASNRLSPTAKAGVKQLLGRHTLDSVANYADQIRQRRPATYMWHFVDIPKDSPTTMPTAIARRARRVIA